MNNSKNICTISSIYMLVGLYVENNQINIREINLTSNKSKTVVSKKVILAVVLSSSFNVFHNLGARNLKDFFPKDVVLTRGNCNLFVPLRPLVLVLAQNGFNGVV